MICAYVSHPQSASAQSARAVTNHFGSVVAFFRREPVQAESSRYSFGAGGAAESVVRPQRDVAAAQRAFSHRARMNGLATRGEWKADLEKKAA